PRRTDRGHNPSSPGMKDWRPGHPAIRRTRPCERIGASPRRSVRPAARARRARPVSRNTDDGAGIGPVPSLEYSVHEETPEAPEAATTLTPHPRVEPLIHGPGVLELLQHTGLLGRRVPVGIAGGG